MRLLLALSLLLLPTTRAADRVIDHNLHGWYILDTENRLRDSPWTFHFDGQWRRHNFITSGQQLLLRPGLGYQLTPTLNLMAGYTFVQTYRYGDRPAFRKSFPEHRIWQQAAFSYGPERFRSLTRIRFENRWLGQVDPITSKVRHFNYENRLRLLQRFTKPLSPRTYLAVYNEYWILIPPYTSPTPFDQNRAYIAFGRRLPKANSLELGYMNQVVSQRNGRIFEANHTFMLTWVSRTPLFRR